MTSNGIVWIGKFGGIVGVELGEQRRRRQRGRGDQRVARFELRVDRQRQFAAQSHGLRQIGRRANAPMLMRR